MPALQWRVMPKVALPSEEDPYVFLHEYYLMREMEREEWEALERQAQRDEWDKKHPRCDACGQFLRKRPAVPGSLDFGLQRDRWVSHYVQDYWGEWDHI